MELKRFKKIETHYLKGYEYDGTFECAKMIFDNIKKINPEYVVGFKMNYNFQNDEFLFDCGGWKIHKGDLVAIRDDDNRMSSYQVIEVISKKDIEFWGYIKE